MTGQNRRHGKHLKFPLTIILTFTTLLQVSCYREPFDLDVSAFGPTVVIDGSITDQEGPQTVRINRTGDLTSINSFPRVSGAEVIIMDDFNNVTHLSEITDGIYQTYELTGIPGRSYTLIVHIKGDTYTASCVMPQPMSFEKIQFEPVDPDNHLYEIVCSFRDRPNIGDYCLLNVYYNRHLVDYYLYKDDITDGQEVVLEDFDILYGQNDLATVELLTLDKHIYDFFYTLDVMVNAENSEFLETFVPVTTLNPTTNLDNGALGYFSAHTIRSYELNAP